MSSLTFGLLHVPNAFFGQSVKLTAQQVFLAFGIGTAYYVTRRISGVLVIPMVLHGAWDFSTFIQGKSVDLLDDKAIAIGGLVMGPVVLISLIAIWRLHHDNGDVVEPGADQQAAFETALVSQP